MIGLIAALVLLMGVALIQLHSLARSARTRIHPPPPGIPVVGATIAGGMALGVALAVLDRSGYHRSASVALLILLGLTLSVTSIYVESAARTIRQQVRAAQRIRRADVDRNLPEETPEANETSGPDGADGDVNTLTHTEGLDLTGGLMKGLADFLTTPFKGICRHCGESTSDATDPMPTCCIRCADKGLQP